MVSFNLLYGNFLKSWIYLFIGGKLVCLFESYYWYVKSFTLFLVKILLQLGMFFE